MPFERLERDLLDAQSRLRFLQEFLNTPDFPPERREEVRERIAFRQSRLAALPNPTARPAFAPTTTAIRPVRRSLGGDGRSD